MNYLQILLYKEEKCKKCRYVLKNRGCNAIDTKYWLLPFAIPICQEKGCYAPKK